MNFFQTLTCVVFTREELYKEQLSLLVAVMSWGFNSKANLVGAGDTVLSRMGLVSAFIELIHLVVTKIIKK